MIQENIAITEAWFKAFNDKDLEGLLMLYDDRAEHYSPKLRIRQPETHGRIQGKKSLRHWWSDSFDRLPSLRYEVKHIIANEDRVFMEYVRTVHGEQEMMVGEVLEIKDGKIIASRVFHS